MGIKGAGGTDGGISKFFIGVGMIALGLYLFLQSVHVQSGFGFGFGYRLYSIGGFGLTSGMILIPLLFGVGFVFYDAKKSLGWCLAIGSLGALIVGILASLHFRMRPMSTFDLLVIMVLAVGGAGLFLSSLKDNRGESASSEASPPATG